VSNPELFEVPLTLAEPLVRGSLWCEPTGSGFVPVRLPQSAWVRVPNLWAREMYRMSAGVRLAFTTTSRAFELDVRASVMAIAGGLLPDAPVTFDLSVNGTDHGAYELAHAGVRSFDMSTEPVLVDETAAQPVTLRFDGLAPSEKAVEVWFPANAVVEVTGLRASKPLTPFDETRPRWLHHGSSISHCREVRRPTKTWPAIAAELSGVELVNLGVGGNSHLDPFVARAIRDAEADVISLEVGPNIIMDATFTRRTFGPALMGFIDTIRDGHPESPLYIVSPIVAPLLESAAGPLGVDEAGNLTTRRTDGADGWPLLSFERIRQLVDDVVSARSDEDANLVHVDGLELFGLDDAGELADGFHPTPKGYELLGERFAVSVLSPRAAGRSGLGPPEASVRQ
jgi:GDSL-like Lipase/Acylhydrolase family